MARPSSWLNLIDGLRAALAERYVIAHELGRYGVASVWFARDLKHDRTMKSRL